MKLKVLGKTFPTRDSVSLRFAKPPDNFSYLAGQHATFVFKIHGADVMRTYSLSSSPGIDNDLIISVRSVRDGLVSNHLINSPIDEIELNSVSGDFFVKPARDRKRHLIMIAGGSGITPIISMIRAVLKHESESSISLIYSNRSRGHIMFRDEIFKLTQDHPEKFQVYHIITQEQDPVDFPVFFRGRVSRLVLKKLLKSITAQIEGDCEFYTCGPFGFMEVADETLKAMDISPSKIYKEVFYSPGLAESSFPDLPAQEIILDMNDEEKFLEVSAGQTILQAALSKNINLAYSCTQGQCGLCRAALIRGEIKLRKNHILTEDEINAGQVLLCQSFPVTGNVIVKPLNRP